MAVTLLQSMGACCGSQLSIIGAGVRLGGNRVGMGGGTGIEEIMTGALHCVALRCGGGGVAYAVFSVYYMRLCV